jgi:hypothetical protein
MQLDDKNFMMQMFLGVVTDLIEPNMETAKAGEKAFHRDDVIELLGGEISLLDAGGRKQLAEAIFHVCAASVWGKADA